MMYKVFGTQEYERRVAKWDKVDREVAEKLPYDLARNPYVGDQLSYPFLREKKIRDKRIYYLVYDDLVLVLMVGVSGKKDQQRAINIIKKRLSEFRKIAEDLSKQA